MTDGIDTESKENARAYRSTPTSDMVVDNTLTDITKWTYIWKSGSNTNATCNFSELKTYATDEHIRFLISKFQQSGWRDASKVENFRQIRKILAYVYHAQGGKQKVPFSPEACAQFIHANYLSIASTGKGVSNKLITTKTLGHQGSRLNSICKKFGLGQIPK